MVIMLIVTLEMNLNDDLVILEITFLHNLKLLPVGRVQGLRYPS